MAPTRSPGPATRTRTLGHCGIKAAGRASPASRGRRSVQVRAARFLTDDPKPLTSRRYTAASSEPPLLGRRKGGPGLPAATAPAGGQRLKTRALLSLLRGRRLSLGASAGTVLSGSALTVHWHSSWHHGQHLGWQPEAPQPVSLRHEACASTQVPIVLRLPRRKGPRDPPGPQAASDCEEPSCGSSSFHTVRLRLRVGVNDLPA